MAKIKVVLVTCGSCANCTPVTSPENLLSIKGEPILGRCPHWTESKSVLLSWPHPCKFYNNKMNNKVQ